MNKTKSGLRIAGITYLVIFAFTFFLMFIYPKPIVNIMNLFVYHGKLTSEIYTSVFHLPSNSLVNQWLINYHKFGNTNLINYSSWFGTLFLFLITCNNTLLNFDWNNNIFQPLVKISVSLFLSFFTAKLTAVSLFSDNTQLSNLAISIIGITGVFAIVSIAINQDK